jgi:hypothetical protein
LVLLHGLLTLEKLQNVMDVTPAPTVFWQTEQITKRGLTRTNNKEGTDMKKTGLVFALAFAFTTGMVVVTVVSHTDRAMADSAGTVIVYPEQATACDGTNC